MTGSEQIKLAHGEPTKIILNTQGKGISLQDKLLLLSARPYTPMCHNNRDKTYLSNGLNL